ncbi:MAG: MFS transporter [Thermoguttaceae bacterium]
MSERANDPYAVWRQANFRLYCVGWFLLVFGKMIETVAVGVHVYDRTDDYLSLGWVGLCQALPVMLLAIAGGQIADRFDRRRVMLVTLSLGTAVSAGLAAAAWWELPVGSIYVLLAVGASAHALGTPSRAAILPQIVSSEIFANAVTWNSTVFQIASMTGPAVGGLIIDLAGGTAHHGARSTAYAFALVVVCRILAVAAIFVLRCQSPIRSRAPVSLATLVAGIRYVWRTKLILATITLDLFAVLLGGATYLLPAIARDILHVGARGLGFLRSAEAIGAVSMAVLLAHLPPMRRAGRTLLWAVGGFGAATIIFGLSQWFWLSLAMMFLIGALDNISVVVRHTLVQMLTPDEMRGRVSAVNSVFIVASNDIGGLESGVTAWMFGLVRSVVVGGVGSILVVLAASRIWPQILSIGSLKEIGAAEMAQAEQDAEEELEARGD